MITVATSPATTAPPTMNRSANALLTPCAIMTPPERPPQLFGKPLGHAVIGDHAEMLAVIGDQPFLLDAAKGMRLLEQRLEHGGKIARRRIRRSVIIASERRQCLRGILPARSSAASEALSIQAEGARSSRLYGHAISMVSLRSA